MPIGTCNFLNQDLSSYLAVITYYIVIALHFDYFRDLAENIDPPLDHIPFLRDPNDLDIKIQRM